MRIVCIQKMIQNNCPMIHRDLSITNPSSNNIGTSDRSPLIQSKIQLLTHTNVFSLINLSKQIFYNENLEIGCGL